MVNTWIHLPKPVVISNAFKSRLNAYWKRTLRYLILPVMRLVQPPNRETDFKCVATSQMTYYDVDYTSKHEYEHLTSRKSLSMPRSHEPSTGKLTANTMKTTMCQLYLKHTPLLSQTYTALNNTFLCLIERVCRHVWYVMPVSRIVQGGLQQLTSKYMVKVGVPQITYFSL